MFISKRHGTLMTFSEEHTHGRDSWRIGYLSCWVMFCNVYIAPLDGGHRRERERGNLSGRGVVFTPNGPGQRGVSQKGRRKREVLLLLLLTACQSARRGHHETYSSRFSLGTTIRLAQHSWQEEGGRSLLTAANVISSRAKDIVKA